MSFIHIISSLFPSLLLELYLTKLLPAKISITIQIKLLKSFFNLVHSVLCVIMLGNNVNNDDQLLTISRDRLITSSALLVQHNNPPLLLCNMTTNHDDDRKFNI